MPIFASGSLLELVIFGLIAGGMFFFQKFVQKKEQEQERLHENRPPPRQQRRRHEGGKSSWDVEQLRRAEERLMKNRKAEHYERVRQPKRKSKPDKPVFVEDVMRARQEAEKQAAEELARQRRADHDLDAMRAALSANEIGSASELRASLGEFLEDPHAMRKAVVLSEILDRPISMRPPKTL